MQPNRNVAVFLSIWLSQMISMLGSSVTGFAFGIWIYQQRHSVSEYGLFAFANVAPLIVVSPFAGVLVDRWNRRSAMLLADVASAAITLAIFVLLCAGRLQPWHIFAASAANAALRALHWPAYTAATAQLVPTQHYGRASGLVSFGEGLSNVAAPVIAGALLGLMALRRLVLLDLASFAVAIVTLALVRIPPPVPVSAPAPATPSSDGKAEPYARQLTFGWRYVKARPGLVALLGFVAISNLTENLVVVLIAPLVLGNADEAVLGGISSVAGLGVVLGAIAMSVWGGPRRRVRALVGFMAVRALMLFVVALPFRASRLAAAAFIFSACIQLSIGTLQTIWLKKVPSDVQGRVFAVRMMIATSMIPLALLGAGPLVTHVFEPLISVAGPFAGSLGRIIGAGPGRGIALLFVVFGVINLALAGLASLYPRLMNLEDELPDAVAPVLPVPTVLEA
jgi:DHA3 family macrolide efflux protein-like MFS transporter